jgi:hypothetical protein
MLKSEKLSAIFIKGLANYFANRSTRLFYVILLLCANLFSRWRLAHE